VRYHAKSGGLSTSEEQRRPVISNPAERHAYSKTPLSCLVISFASLVLSPLAYYSVTHCECDEQLLSAARVSCNIAVNVAVFTTLFIVTIAGFDPQHS